MLRKRDSSTRGSAERVVYSKGAAADTRSTLVGRMLDHPKKIHLRMGNRGELRERNPWQVVKGILVRGKRGYWEKNKRENHSRIQ